jgi:hypothetical protein
LAAPLFDYGGHGLGTANGAAAQGEATAVPEPGSLPLLLAGLGLIGGAMYFGRKKVAAAKTEICRVALLAVLRRAQW